MTVKQIARPVVKMFYHVIVEVNAKKVRINFLNKALPVLQVVLNQNMGVFCLADCEVCGYTSMIMN